MSQPETFDYDVKISNEITQFYGNGIIPYGLVLVSSMMWYGIRQWRASLDFEIWCVNKIRTLAKMDEGMSKIPDRRGLYSIITELVLLSTLAQTTDEMCNTW